MRTLCYLENSLIISIFSEPKHHLCVCVCVCVCVSCSVVSNSWQPHGLWPARLFCQWDSPGKNTGEGCLFLPQGIFPGQGSKPSLLHWQVDSLPLCHLGSLKFNLQHVNYEQVPTLFGPQSEARMSFLMFAYFSLFFSLLSLTCNLS